MVANLTPQEEIRIKLHETANLKVQEPKVKEVNILAHMKESKKRELTPEHLEALAVGRREAKIVDRYLRAIRPPKNRRGRPRTLETLQARLSRLEAEVDTVTPARALAITAQMRELTDEIKAMKAEHGTHDIEKYETEFIAIAADFSKRRKITKAIWRDFGVAEEVLDKAGIA